MKKSEGLTLIELVMVIAIIVFTVSLTLISLNRSRMTRNLITAGQNTLSLFQLAQSKTLASENNAEWGIHLESAEIVLFQGTSFVGATSTTAYPLPSGI